MMQSNFLKLGENWPVAELLGQLAAQPGLWDQHTARLRGPHSQVHDIWVRYNDLEPYLAKGSLEGFNDLHVPIWYPAWRALPALRPIVFRLMTMVRGEMLGGVLITKVPAGASIAPHKDASWHVDYFDKFYVCLEGGPGREFVCRHVGKDEVLTPTPGDVHRFDNRKLHWVNNYSNEDRMTLIVCIHTEMFNGHP